MGRHVVALFVVGALAQPASAEILRLSAEVQAGGMYGQGVSGDQKDNAFFAKSPHFLYGVNLAAELFFFDLWVQHQQFADFSGDLTTWTQFGVGLHGIFDTGTAEQKKLRKGSFFELGGGVYFGLGTPIQVKPPLTRAQLSDQGFLVEVRPGFGTHLNKFFDVAFELPVSYGYFTKPNDSGCSANNLSCNYQSAQIEGLVVLRGTLRFL